METMIRYRGDGQRVAWFVPFAVSGPGDIGAARLSGGMEKRLVHGADYVLRGQYVFCAVQAGDILALWLEGSPDAAAQRAEDAALASMANGAMANGSQPVMASGPAYVAQSGNDSGAEAGAVDLEADLARARQTAAMEIETSLADMRARLADLAAGAAAQMEAVAAEVLANARRSANLVAMQSPGRAAMTLAEVGYNGKALSLPMSYAPFMNALEVFQDGRLLRPGADYDEYGQQGQASDVIILLRDYPAGSELTFITLPTHVSMSANEAAQRAELSSTRAAQAAQQAETAAQALSVNTANICDCANDSAAQAGLAAKSADMAHEGAVSAWRAACAASMHNFRPGIAAVHSLNEISCCAHGLFIINPHITHAPTPFMGVWPVSDISKATWDGVFFIGEPYPCPCALPPKCECPPKPELPVVAGTGDSDDWDPCGHVHSGGCACLRK